MNNVDGVFHLLLIGVDLYETSALGQLEGCTNDVDAIEALFVEPPGIGFSPERIQVTRLVSTSRPRESRAHTAREKGATRTEILDTLEELEAVVRPQDRVHLHYSGHGGQYMWTDRTWSEGLLTSEGNWVTDTELNQWIDAIAAKTDDVTVVLDCCHSSGATRGAQAPASDPDAAATRDGGRGASGRLPTPGEGGLRLPSGAAVGGLSTDGRILRPDPRYMVLAACQSHEVAQEKVVGAGTRHGLLTHSFVRSLSRIDTPEGRAALKWADIWPDLLDTAAAAAEEAPAVPRQQPWLIGRPERRVFGGPWKEQDLGFAVRRDDDGAYRVRAGTLMGITPGAELAVYGAEPARFPEIGSSEDVRARAGILVVDAAKRTECTAHPVGDPFSLPDGARARVIRPVASQQLRVQLQPVDPEVQAVVDASDQLVVVGTGESAAEVLVTGTAESGWTIANDVDPRVATVPPGKTEALRAGLEQYARYNQVLRLVESCADVELQGCLSTKCLSAPNAGEAKSLVGPALERWLDALGEVPKEDGVYSVHAATPFVVQVRNTSGRKLRVFLFDCAAGGQAYYMGDNELRGDERDVFWYGGRIGNAFVAEPTGSGSETLDRFVVVGTTNEQADLTAMGTNDSVQAVVDKAAASTRGGRGIAGLAPEPVENPELWTATVVPMIMSAG